MGARGWLRCLTRERRTGASRPPSPAAAPAESLADAAAGSRRPVPGDSLLNSLGVDPGTPWGQPPLSAAMAKVQREVDPEQFQMWHLYVLRHWPARKVARKLGVNLGRVYLARYSIGRQIKAEAKPGKTTGARPLGQDH